MSAVPHHDRNAMGEFSGAHVGLAYQAYRILQTGFVVAPIIAGLDKFTDKLVNWDMYLAPQIANLLGGAHGAHAC